MDLPIAVCRIKARINREIRWNSFPGSVIHGVLGMHLKIHTCVVPHRNCGICYLKHSCPYSIIYESPLPPDSERMRLYPQIPHPIRLVVHPWDRPRLYKGEEFEVKLVLIGKCVSYLLMVLMAIESGFSEGVGRKHSGERGSADIIEIEDGLTGSSQKWSDLKRKYSNGVSAVPIEDLIAKIDDRSLHVKFTTPTKIVTKNKVNFDPSFRDILSSLLRRTGSLFYFYGDGESEIDYSGLLSDAEAIEYSSVFKKVPVIRYSGSQTKTISISGFIGEMHIKQCPAEIGRYLEIGQYIGLGKSTTMGLGDYCISNG